MSATVAETVWYQEDSASPLTVSKPAGFGIGQMLVVVIVQHNNPSAQTDLTTPSGWTFQGALDGTQVDGKVFSYVYTGTDPATWDFPYKSTADVVAGLFRITGADVTTPTLVVSTTPASVSSPMDSPSVTPTGTDDLLLALISDICNGTILAATFPSGMTDLGLGEVAGHFMSSRAAYQQLASGSATGVRTWTSVSPTGIEGGTWTVAVKSATAGGASVTPGPLVVTPTPRTAPTGPILLRGALADQPMLTTPQPIVVRRQPQVAPSTVMVLRSAADAPVLTSAQPYIVSRPATVIPGAVMTLRSSLVDAVVATGTPAPIVVTPAPKTAPVPPILLLRATLADAAQLTTPGPLVVGPAYKPTPIPLVLLSRSTLADPVPQTTPGPYVVTHTVRTTAGPVVLLRAPAAPPAGTTSAQPYIVTSQPTRARTTAILLAAPSIPGGAPTLAGGQLASTTSTPRMALTSATGTLATSSSTATLTSTSGGDQ